MAGWGFFHGGEGTVRVETEVFGVEGLVDQVSSFVYIQKWLPIVLIKLKLLIVFNDNVTANVHFAIGNAMGVAYG